MENKELKIIPPEGYEIDKENSTLECIKFKPKQKRLTYKDVSIKLFLDKEYYSTSSNGEIFIYKCYRCYDDPNNALSKKQLEKLLAINKLMNVAKYLNDGWKPDWNDATNKYFIYCTLDNCIVVDFHRKISIAIVYFKTKELAEQAISILGKDTIRLALSTNY